MSQFGTIGFFEIRNPETQGPKSRTPTTRFQTRNPEVPNPKVERRCVATLDDAKDVVHVIRTSAYDSYANADKVLPETRIPKPET